MRSIDRFLMAPGLAVFRLGFPRTARYLLWPACRFIELRVLLGIASQR